MTPIIRIVLRYGSGALVAKGMITPDDAANLATFAADPDVLIIVGFIIGGATEAWYAIAKRLGWAS